MQNPEVFDGKNFQELLQDIYNNVEAKRAEIKTLMDGLTPHVTSAKNAAIIAPLIREFLEVAVKNDEHLVKMATIMQRIMSSQIKASAGTENYGLTEKEKEQLLLEAETTERDAVDELKAAIEGMSVADLKQKVDDVKTQLEE
jgi:hypothetical protein